MQGLIGEVAHQVRQVDSHTHNDTHFYLYTHLDFTLAYHDDRVIAVNVTTDPHQRIELVFGENVRLML